jgi:hypothetical protein
MCNELKKDCEEGSTVHFACSRNTREATGYLGWTSRCLIKYIQNQNLRKLQLFTELHIFSCTILVDEGLCV